jgi:hypothetical protein
MEPWSVMNYPADKLAALLASPDSGAARHVVSVNGEDAGVVSVRHPWLKGPYLELLALLPQAQRQGIGRASWPGSNPQAYIAPAISGSAPRPSMHAAYASMSHGFTRAATLPSLVADGYDEILLRKFPLGPGT